MLKNHLLSAKAQSLTSHGLFALRRASSFPYTPCVTYLCQHSTLPSMPTGTSAVYVDEGDNDLLCEDSASDGCRDDGKLELDREWQRRQNQFHTIGYRDGLLAGKEASAQEGFNAGFRESVVAGYNWGLVRGITSTLTCLPDELKAKRIGRSDKRDELQALYEATRSVSSNEALSFFHDDVMNRNSLDGGPDSSGDLIQPNVLGDFSYCGKLESFKKKLKSVVSESPASGITAIVESKMAG